MTDLHTHILPSIDDGAKNEEIALEMLKREIEQGVKTVVFTPHYYGKKHSPAQFLERRAAAYEKIKTAVEEMGLDVRLGAEVYMGSQRITDEQSLAVLAIEGTKYILIELPLSTVWQPSLWERIEELVERTEYTPIVAHVERYAEIKKHPEYLTRLVAAGCLLQVNTRSFLDESSKKFAFLLLEKGLVHCISTDAHNLEERAPDYALVKAELESRGKKEKFEELQENMRAILRGENLKIPAPAPVKRFLGKYF